MAAEIIQINAQNLESQVYDSQDTNLIPTFDVNTSLTSGSYIEYFIYDLNQNLEFHFLFLIKAIFNFKRLRKVKKN